MKYIKTLENHINEPKVGDFVVAKQKGMGPFVKTMDTRIGKIIGKTERFFSYDDSKNEDVFKISYDKNITWCVLRSDIIDYSKRKKI